MNSSCSGSSISVVVRGQDRLALAAGDFDDRAAVGGFQRPPVENLLRRPEGDLRAVEAEHRVAAPRLIEIVGGDGYPSPLFRQLVDQRFEGRRTRVVEAREGL